MSYVRIGDYYKYRTNINELLIVPVKKETILPLKITTSLDEDSSQIMKSFNTNYLFKNPMLAGEIRPIHKEISKNMNELSF